MMHLWTALQFVIIFLLITIVFYRLVITVRSLPVLIQHSNDSALRAGVLADFIFGVFGAFTYCVFIYLFMLHYDFIPKPSTNSLVTFSVWFRDSIWGIVFTVSVILLFGCVVLFHSLSFSKDLRQIDQFHSSDSLRFFGYIGTITISYLSFGDLAPYLIGFLTGWGELK